MVETIRVKNEVELDFSNAATFRDLQRVSADSVQLVDRQISLSIQGQPLVLEPGDFIMRLAPGQYRYFAFGEYEKRYEVDPASAAFFRSRDEGKILWIQDPIILDQGAGVKTLLKKGDAIFRSDLDQTITFYHRHEVKQRFARKLSNGSLVPLSEPVGIQLLAIRKAGDENHLREVTNSRHWLSALWGEVGDVVLIILGGALQNLGSAAIGKGAHVATNAALHVADAHLPGGSILIRLIGEAVAGSVSTIVVTKGTALMHTATEQMPHIIEGAQDAGAATLKKGREIVSAGQVTVTRQIGQAADAGQSLIHTSREFVDAGQLMVSRWFLRAVYAGQFILQMGRNSIQSLRNTKTRLATAARQGLKKLVR